MAHPGDPLVGRPQNQFFELLNLGSQLFFDISRYLAYKYFDVVWGYHIPGYPQMDSRKNNFLNGIS